MAVSQVACAGCFFVQALEVLGFISPVYLFIYVSSIELWLGIASNLDFFWKIWNLDFSQKLRYPWTEVHCFSEPTSA